MDDFQTEKEQARIVYLASIKTGSFFGHQLARVVRFSSNCLLYLKSCLQRNCDSYPAINDVYGLKPALLVDYTDENFKLYGSQGINIEDCERKNSCPVNYNAEKKPKKNESLFKKNNTSESYCCATNVSQVDELIQVNIK